VRWETVVGTTASGKTQATYQVASDHWYLFNFSDAKASHRKAPFTFHPFVTSDLRIFGDAKSPKKTQVVFLAIHLAPWLAAKDGKPFNQAKWFDNVDVSYKLHADKVVPANIQDLQRLVTLVTGIQTPQEKQIPATKNLQPNLPFQGRYTAGLVTNLRDLPAKLTSTMTATFSGQADSSEVVPAYCAPVDKSLASSGVGTAITAACAASSQTTDVPPSDTPVSTSLQPTDDFKRSDAIVGRWSASDRPARLLFTNYNFRPLFQQSAQNPRTSIITNSLAINQPVAGTSTTTAPKAQPAPPGANCNPVTNTDPTTNATLQKSCTLTQTITDEGLYHWDVSIGIPTGYKETVFDSTNTLMPKSVTRVDAYAMLDIAPWGEDFVKPPMFGIPHLMTGLPISGKVFDKPFIGGLGEEVGLTKFLPFSARIFAGVVYNKEFRGATEEPHRVWKVQYGIELSLSSAISKLKGNTTANTTTGTTK
jgi:hypothetical protein